MSFHEKCEKTFSLLDVKIKKCRKLYKYLQEPKVSIKPVLFSVRVITFCILCEMELEHSLLMHIFSEFITKKIFGQRF